MKTTTIPGMILCLTLLAGILCWPGKNALGIPPASPTEFQLWDQAGLTPPPAWADVPTPQILKELDQLIAGKSFETLTEIAGIISIRVQPNIIKQLLASGPSKDVCNILLCSCIHPILLDYDTLEPLIRQFDTGQGSVLTRSVFVYRIATSGWPLYWKWAYEQIALNPQRHKPQNAALFAKLDDQLARTLGRCVQDRGGKLFIDKKAFRSIVKSDLKTRHAYGPEVAKRWEDVQQWLQQKADFEVPRPMTPSPMSQPATRIAPPVHMHSA